MTGFLELLTVFPIIDVVTRPLVRKQLQLYPFLELNISFILMSTSGVLGKVIPLPPSVIIFWRCMLAFALLFFFIKLRVREGIRSNHRGFFIGSGILLAVHWTTYFHSIKLGGVAVGMLSLFTYPIITSLLEPLLFKIRFSWFDIASSLLILWGLSLMVPEFSLENEVVQGILWGIFSALIYSLRNLWNKKYIKEYSGSTIMCYQLLISAVVLAPALWIFPVQISTISWIYLFILTVVTTAIAHTLFVQGLKHFSTSSVSIMSSLIPLYGVAWAVLFTDEVLNKGIILGGAIIIMAIIAQNVKYFRR